MKAVGTAVERSLGSELDFSGETGEGYDVLE